MAGDDRTDGILSLRRQDFLLIGALLAAALALLVYMRLGMRAGGEAVVRVDGAVQARYALSADGEYPLNGGTNVLRIENGTAFMVEADCPDHICIRQGPISRTRQTITCLPNRLTVTVEGGQEDVEIVG